ncbi:hypothetical protein ACWZEH_34555 (plasmid) [Streptomyces sp. QTS137]
MKTTLIKLATTSAMALVVTSTAAIPAHAAPRPPPGQSSPAPIPGTICKVSGIVGWFGGLIGGNDVCGDDYDDTFPEVSN